MKKIAILLLLVICLGILVVSCPDANKHKDAVSQMVSEKIQQKMSEEDDDEAFAIVGGTLAKGLVSFFIDKNFSLDNYFIFSVGKLNINDKINKVSFGILGHVFTMKMNQTDVAEDDAKNSEEESV